MTAVDHCMLSSVIIITASDEISHLNIMYNMSAYNVLYSFTSQVCRLCGYGMTSIIMKNLEKNAKNM